MITIEQEIIQRYAPDSFLLDQALADNSKAILFCKYIEKELLNLSIFYDPMLKRRLAEALLSPVAWIRERASQLSKES